MSAFEVHIEKRYHENGGMMLEEQIDKEALHYSGQDNAADEDARLAEEYTMAITPQTDDPSTPAFTFRAVFLGTIWGVVLACLNILFAFRTNAFSVPGGIVQLLAYPMGVFMAKVLPSGFLNPGPFSVKEHVLIYIIASSAGGQPYGVDNVIGQYAKPFMNDKAINFWNGIAWVAVSQLVGYGVAGVCRRFLVKPAAMLWPSALPNVALFTALNGVETESDQNSKYPMSRYSFFWLAFFAMFVWSWIPGFFATALSSVAILCLITKNRTARFLGSAGTFQGMGLFAFSFDWSSISAFSPLATPWWATLNWLFGTILWQWIVVPLTYYQNTWGSPELQSQYHWPDNSTFGVLNSNKIYNSTGHPVFIRRVNPKTSDPRDYNSLLNPDFTLNEKKFEQQGPFFLSNFFVITYFCSFVNIAAVVSHVGLWYGRDIYRQTKAAFQQLDTANGMQDTHNRLMRAYPDIPEWMYLVWLAVFSVASVAVCQFTPFYMPWWASAFAIGLGLVMTIPIGLIYAVSGTLLGLNVLTEFVIGLILPGQPVPVISFKSLGFNVLIQALALTGDLKLGHYMHIPPIAMVLAQLIGTLIGIFFNTGGAFYIMDCMTSPKIFEDPKWSGIDFSTFLNAAGIWGAIGPARFFGKGTPYYSLMFGFLIGILLPFLPWIGNKIFPNKNWHLINMPLLTISGGPGRELSYVLPVALIGFISQYWAFNYRKEWFNKYNYVLATALDSGMSIATLCIAVVTNLAPAEAQISPVGGLSPTGSNNYYCNHFFFVFQANPSNFI